MSPDPGVDALTCRDLIEFLRAYLDGELPSELRRRFEDHLDACPPCLHYLDSYRETVSLAGEASGACGAGEALPEDVPEELVRAILAARPRG
jgi:anti-sigma factor (TIGR02949 family)